MPSGSRPEAPLGITSELKPRAPSPSLDATARASSRGKGWRATLQLRHSGRGSANLNAILGLRAFGVRAPTLAVCLLGANVAAAQGTATSTAQYAPARPAPAAAVPSAVSSAAALATAPAAPSTPGATAPTDSGTGSSEPNQVAPENPAEWYWYGWSLAIVDGFDLALMAGGLGSENQSLFAVGAGFMMGDGLLGHMLWNGSGRGIAKGLLSLVLRGGLGIGGCALGPSCFVPQPSDWALGRMAGGLVIAAVLDDAFLARVKAPTSNANDAFAVHPMVAARPTALTVGAEGTW